MNTLQAQSKARRTAFKFAGGLSTTAVGFDTTTTGTSVTNTTTTVISMFPTCQCQSGLK